MQKFFFLKSLIFLFTLSLAATAFAASGNIEGHVRDAQTGKALPGANVILKETSMGAASNVNGKYVIHDIPPGTYTISASYIGYESEKFIVKVKNNFTVEQNFKLKPVGVKGKTVVVTAQANGQNQAINEQLSSSQIASVVSAARIQELPDQNAAESVGRLPGVSLIRQGGEGSQVVIRGLAPQYNMITIDGVQVPPDLGSNRAVDLSDISSSMLGGIEVIKAITPDMDAAELGGTVNFQLREARTTKPKFSLLAQSGYDGLQNTYSDYKFVGTGEARFFDSHFGIFGEINIGKRDLSSNDLGVSYYLNDPKLNQNNPVYLSSLSLTDIPRQRKRYGATVVMDYKLPGFKVDLMNIISSGDTKEQVRREDYSLTSNYHAYIAEEELVRLTTLTDLLDIKKDLPLFSVDLKLSHSYSENSIPNATEFEFLQNLVGLGSINYQSLNPQAVPSLAKNDLSKTYLNNAEGFNSFYRNRNITASVDFQSTVNFSKNISSIWKFGGEYRYTILSNNYTSDNNLLYISGSDSVTQSILNEYPWMKKTVPNGSLQLPITVFEDNNFSYGNFLGGGYHMGVPLNIGLLQQVLNFLNVDTVKANSYDYLENIANNNYTSVTNNYTGNEYESAAYIMSTFHFGSILTFLPGVRYQQLVTSYTAPRGTQTPILYEYSDTTINQIHGYLLPMVHLIYHPFSWLQLHLAYTNTLNYPSYKSIIPRINIGFTSVAWNNYALKPARSTNYDAILSIYDNSIGLFTVDGFLKHISDLIFPTTTYVINPAEYPGIPKTTKGEPLSTYINNPNKVDLWGVELDWETHFWYLPGPLSGLVLSANFTHIFSQAKYPLVSVKTVYYPRYSQKIVNSYYKDRLIYQPNNIANLNVGYDYKGFSGRVSMTLTSNVFEGDNYWPALRVNTAKYIRWDLSVKQVLPWYGIQIFFDVNNLNNAKDLNVNQGSGYPTSESYYGTTADLGLRKSF